MEDSEGFLPVLPRKRTKSKDLQKDDNPSSSKCTIVDHETSEDESEKLSTPSVVEQLKTTVILRLETIVSAKEQQPNLLTMLNETMMELMKLNTSIEIKPFKEDSTMDVFEKLTANNVGQYMTEFKDTAGDDNNLYTVLFKVSWAIGTTTASLFKNFSLRKLLKDNHSFLKEHTLSIGSIGSVGHIYLIDPQTFNVSIKEKEYNMEIKKYLAESNDYRLNNIKDIGNYPLVEFRLKHYGLTTTTGNVTKTMNISTVEVKCLRQHSQSITTLLAEANRKIDIDTFGFFLQYRAIKDKIPEYIAIAKRHYNIMSKTGRTTIYNISRYLMTTKTADGKSLYNDLMGIQLDDNMMQEDIEIINLEPSESTWMITSPNESKARVEEKIKTILEEFMKKQLYKNAKGHNQTHKVTEHLRPQRQEIIVNLDQIRGTITIDESTATIEPRASASKRYVHSAFPVGNNTWSKIVQNEDNGSYDGTVGTLQTLQDEHRESIREIERKYMERDAKLTKERYELSQQVAKLAVQYNEITVENAKLRNDINESRHDKAKAMEEMTKMKAENIDMAMLLQESANQINIYRAESINNMEFWNTQKDSSRLERIATEKRHKDEIEQMTRVAVQQTIDAMLNRNGERKTKNVLEVNIANNIDGNSNDIGQHTYIYPATPHINNSNDMEITPTTTIGNNAPTRQRGSHAGRSGGMTNNRDRNQVNNKPSSLQSMLNSSQTMFSSLKEAVMSPMDIQQTPQRANKSNDSSMEDNEHYEDTMEETDGANEEEMLFNDTYPTDPPDLSGERL